MSDQTYDDEQAALAEEIANLAAARAEVQSQTRGLEGDVGSFRVEQRLAWDAAHTANVELATAQGGDFYAPDVGQQIAPDGTVTYDFDAHLHARGLDLDAGTGLEPPSDRRVRWLRQSDGALVADAYAYEDASFRQAILRVTDGSQQAALHGTFDRGAGRVLTQTQVAGPGGSRQRTILDDLGQSDFVQGTARRLTNLDFGNTFISWPGGGAVSNAVVVPHTLGRTPVAYVASMGTPSNLGTGYVVLAGSTASTLSLFGVGNTTFAAGVTANVHWIALA
jgi:hypothetical protein